MHVNHLKSTIYPSLSIFKCDIKCIWKIGCMVNGKIVINLLFISTGTHLIIQIISNYGLFSNFFPFI